MNKQDNRNLLWRYAGLATQFMVGIGLFVFLGMKIDKWMHWRTPVAVWVLPLLLIVGVIIKAIRDTGKNQ